MIDLPNGINAEAPESLASHPRVLTLRVAELRKLQRLYSRADAYNEVMELARLRKDEAQAAFTELLNECLDEAGVLLTQDAQYSINWKTGQVTLMEGSPV